MEASSEPSRFGTKLVVVEPKDLENANIRIPLCADANCGNSAVFQVKYRRHQKNTIILGTLDSFEHCAHCHALFQSAAAAACCVD
jgi:hypothetical protein